MKARGPAPKGRPRAFDADEALDRAMTVFWRHGYEGASLAALTEAMGINRPSLYAAFGNKEALFQRVLDRYAAGPASYMREALEAPTARDVVERLFRGAVEVCADPDGPRGCLFVQGALSCGASADPIRRGLAERRAAGQAALRERFEVARAAGDLPARVDASDLARYVMTVLTGMSIQAAGGASPDDLGRVAAMAMRAAPWSRR